MNIDEAIKHCEEKTEELEKRVKPYQCESINKKLYEVNKKEWDSCIECAKEHRQLAEWLKELKAYKDFEDKGYVMCRFEVTQDDRRRTTKMVLDFSTKELFDNIVEVNADDANRCEN